MVRRLLVLFALAAQLGAQKKPFDVHALMKLARVSEPQLSPDGKMVVFTVETPDLEANTRPKQIYTVPLAGGPVLQITREGSSNQRPRWMPDSRRIAFISNRSGSSQIWTMNADGADPKQVSALATEAGGVSVSQDGKWFVFTSSVYPECLADDACNKKRLDEEKNSKTQARSYNSLLYRHWNEWQSARRQHLLSMPASGGPAKDLTPGKLDVPTFSLGGPDDYVISPDSKEVAYVSDLSPDPATSTNTDIFSVPIGGGEPKRVADGPGGERSPVYSPDGKYLAFRSQSRAGFESDRWRLALADRASGKMTILNEAHDRPVNGITWTPDSTRIFFTTEDRGRTIVQMIPAAGGGSRSIISGASHVDDVQFTPDGKTMLYTEQSASRPAEIFRAVSGGGSPVPLAKLNDALLGEYQLTPAEEIWTESPDKARVHSFIVKPPGFTAGRKYPMLLLIHGGPQGAWGQSWSYRWNPQVFAAAGFVVVMPNPRGSIGYGQKFTDEVSLDWGGKVYDDLMAVTDQAAALPYVDPERMAAAGGSFGGYMANWMLGHTQRFKAFVSHAGVFDLRSMFGETEELFFPLWEFRGAPWDNPELYAVMSPSYYAKEFKTPTLVIHGELDYRVPYGQGLQLFTALQLQKVPSKLLLFPDEGHWILKPQNTLLWYKSFLEWVQEWTTPKKSQ